MAILLPDRIDIATFGEFLRDAREKRGLTLHQIASETRIPWWHLDALEHGNLDAVPAGMYRRAEIRAFADAVGLDRAVALSQFEQAVEVSAAKPEPGETSAAPLDVVRLRTIATTAGALAAIVAATVLSVSLMGQRSQPTVPAPPAPGGPATPSTGGVTPSAPVAATDSVPAEPATVRARVPDAAGEAAPVAAAPSAAADFALTITTDPPGARVLINGIGRGVTPLTVSHLSAGPVRVRVLKDGFASQEQAVRLGAAASHGIHVTLDAVH